MDASPPRRGRVSCATGFGSGSDGESGSTGLVLDGGEAGAAGMVLDDGRPEAGIDDGGDGGVDDGPLNVWGFWLRALTKVWRCGSVEISTVGEITTVGENCLCGGRSRPIDMRNGHIHKDRSGPLSLSSLTLLSSHLSCQSVPAACFTLVHTHLLYQVCSPVTRLVTLTTTCLSISVGSVSRS